MTALATRPIFLRPRRRMAPNNGYAMNTPIADTLRKLTGGIPGGASLVQVRPQRYYHRLAYLAAGQTTQLVFFNSAYNRWVTNLDQAGQLPANTAFALQSICFRLDAGVDINGAAVAGGAEFSATAIAVATIAEQKRLILENGAVEFWVGDKKLMEWYGLDAFPSGRGCDISGGVSTTTASTNYGGFKTNNGAPLWGNRFVFGKPWPIAAVQNFSLRVQHQSALALTGGGVLMAELVGDLILPAGA